MVRSTFGGGAQDLAVSEDTSNVGSSNRPALALARNTAVTLYRADGSVVTDFLILSGGAFVPATEIRADADGVLPVFQGPDGVTELYMTTGGKPALRPVTGLPGPKGDTGPQGPPGPQGPAGPSGGGTAGPVALDVDAATTGQLNAQTKLANLDDAVEEFHPTSTDPAATTLAKRRPTGAVAVATAVNDDEAPPKAQVESMIAEGSGTGGTSVGGSVRSPRVTTGLPWSTSVDGAAWTTAAEPLRLEGGKTGEGYRIALYVAYRAVTASGIEWRFKTAGAGPTTKIENGHFNVNVAGWNTTNSATLAYDTTNPKTGVGSLKVTVITAGTISVWSDWVDCAVGDTFSASIQCKRGSGTARVVRQDLQYGSATATNDNLVTGVVQSFLGEGALQPVTTAWSRLIKDSTHSSGATTGVAVAPSGTTRVRSKFVIANAAVGDVFYFDEAQLEPMDPIPTWGNQGGGSSALAIEGAWSALPDAGALTTASPHVLTPVRFPTVANVGVEAQGHASGAGVDAVLLGSFDLSIGGTGLTEQIVEFEYRQKEANATATQVVAAHATFAKVRAA